MTYGTCSAKLPAMKKEFVWLKEVDSIAMNQDSILQKAMIKWERMSQDSSFRQAYEAREKALMVEATKFAHARNEWIQEGKKAERIQLVRGMYKNGMSVDDIVKFTKFIY